MNYTSTSGEFIKQFIPIFKIDKKNENSIETNEVETNEVETNVVATNEVATKLLKVIYNDIYKAYRESIKHSCLKGVLKKITQKEPAKQPDIYNSKFFPTYIKKYISDNETYQLTYTCIINGRTIHIHFTLFSEEELLKLDDKYLTNIKMIYMWLKICASYSSKSCAKTLDIYIYQTPFLKELPDKVTTTIGVEHVNTAFTISCSPESEIVIFRNEEWFKVLIHETFHAYGLDSGENNTNQLLKFLSQLFPIDSDHNVSEAYAETWARIMNVALCSFNALENKIDLSTFINYMSFNLQLERLFSLYQCNKILGFMGLTYNNIHEPGEKNAYLRKNLYREDTHVFSYYILTAIFLNDYCGFLSWCNNHNTSLLQLNGAQYVFNDLGEYIETQYNNESILNGITVVSELHTTRRDNNKHSNSKKSNSKQSSNKKDKYLKLLNTTRMSIIEFI
jgi:hypothetical protein